MSGVKEGELGKTISRFFEAGAQPSLWPTVLHEASQTFGAEGIVLVPFNIPDVMPVWSEGLDELVEAVVRGNWHVNNARKPLSDIGEAGQHFRSADYGIKPLQGRRTGPASFQC